MIITHFRYLLSSIKTTEPNVNEEKNALRPSAYNLIYNIRAFVLLQLNRLAVVEMKCAHVDSILRNKVGEFFLNTF